MRQAITNNTNTNNAGTPLDPQLLSSIFPGGVALSGYTSEMNGAVSNNGSTTLVARTIFSPSSDTIGKTGINKKMVRTKIDAMGNETREETQSSFDKTQITRIKLPESLFGLAIANKSMYANADSVSKAKTADDTFDFYTKLAEIVALANAKIDVIKTLVVNKAMALGIISANYHAIDLQHPEMKAYWDTEIAPKYTALVNEFSLAALLQPGRLLEGFQVVATPWKNGAGKTIELRRA